MSVSAWSKAENLLSGCLLSPLRASSQQERQVSVSRALQLVMNFSRRQEAPTLLPPTSTAPYAQHLVVPLRRARYHHGHVQVREYHVAEGDERSNHQYVRYLPLLVFLFKDSRLIFC